MVIGELLREPLGRHAALELRTYVTTELNRHGSRPLTSPDANRCVVLV